MRQSRLGRVPLKLISHRGHSDYPSILGASTEATTFLKRVLSWPATPLCAVPSMSMINLDLGGVKRCGRLSEMCRERFRKVVSSRSITQQVDASDALMKCLDRKDFDPLLGTLGWSSIFTWREREESRTILSSWAPPGRPSPAAD